MRADLFIVKQFEGRSAEYNATPADLEEQLIEILPEDVLDPAMDDFYVIRYALDLELILALRNTDGYLFALRLTDENQKIQIFGDAIGASFQNIHGDRTDALDILLLERAKRSKSKVVLLKEVQE